MIAPESSGAVRSPKTAELLAQTLRRMIVDGRLTDGDYLPHEADLTTHFQVSRPTLREAVRILESDRLVRYGAGHEPAPGSACQDPRSWPDRQACCWRWRVPLWRT